MTSWQEANLKRLDEIAREIVARTNRRQRESVDHNARGESARRANAAYRARKRAAGRE
jgi:hypothetical protein